MSSLALARMLAVPAWLPAALVWTLAVTVPGAALAADTRLVLTDGCADQDSPEFEMTLELAGDGPRPSALRTTILFDPALIQPVAEDARRKVVKFGSFSGGGNVVASYDLEPRDGRIDLVFNTAGKLPVPELPPGTMATLRLKLTRLAPENGVLRVDIDSGETRSLDGNSTSMFTAIAGPAYVWVGRSGPGVQVKGEGSHLLLQTSGDLLRERAWFVRGRASQVQKYGRFARLGSLEALPTEGGKAVDDLVPDKGEIFYYLVAQPDSGGRPMLGFGSDCRVRVEVP